MGTGVDIIEVERIRRLVGRYGDRFLRRVYHPSEVGYCLGQERYRRLAARYAAKEAILKAIGTGLRRSRWHDMEVVRDPLGHPEVRLSGNLAQEAAQRGIERIVISLSHTREYAVAQALAIGRGTDGMEGGFESPA